MGFFRSNRGESSAFASQTVIRISPHCSLAWIRTPIPAE
ncbi:hypothetical protein CPT_Musica_047 [Burkholderia phage Musica]|uniref:Uncharacterized protein n=1 Tax=Burkholderia phage Musica TaxID=2924903 RepID=A0AAE9G8F8_9CAUD|nr:hypothetical protein CPT_Musica_047 [Burkholderia phage Musica]